MIPPVDISDMLAEIQCSFRELQFLVPDEGPWGWEHPALLSWLADNNFPSKDELLDNPAATHVLVQSLRKKLWKCKELQCEQLTLPIVVTPHWGAWIAPGEEAA